MCKRCADNRTWHVPLDEAVPCASENCENPAKDLVYAKYVDLHLCPGHLDRWNEELEISGHAIRGEGHFSRDFLPFDGAVSCSHFVDHPLLDDLTPCRAKAVWAEVIIEQWPLCEADATRFEALYQ